MLEKMEQMSIHNFKVQEESQANSKAVFDREHKLLDALVKYLVEEEVKMVLARSIGLASEKPNVRECNKAFKESLIGQNIQINKIQLHDEEELVDKVVPQTIITIQIGNEQKLVQALIDTRLDCNTISQLLFQ